MVRATKYTLPLQYKLFQLISHRVTTITYSFVVFKAHRHLHCTRQTTLHSGPIADIAMQLHDESQSQCGDESRTQSEESDDETQSDSEPQTDNDWFRKRVTDTEILEHSMDPFLGNQSSRPGASIQGGWQGENAPSTLAVLTQQTTDSL